MSRRRALWVRIAIYGSLAVLLFAAYLLRRPIRHMIMNRTLTLPPTVESVLAKYSPAVQAEFEPVCRHVGIAYPPAKLQMLAFKEEALLEIWGADREGPFRYLATFPILGLSGKPGPKRKSGDLQVPEGFYRLTTLNPQSSFHLSIRVDYPNEEDIRNSTVPRDQMGSDIYIHGQSASIGCLAMGNLAIEKIFCLAALADPGYRNIIIAPKDFRNGRAEIRTDEAWVTDLYTRIDEALKCFRAGGSAREGEEESLTQRKPTG